MDDRYVDWVKTHLSTQNSRQTAISDARRIEANYGNLDELYEVDGLEAVLSELTYSAIDERNDEPNPSQIPINGDLRKGLASYKSALSRYIRFKEDITHSLLSSDHETNMEDGLSPQTFGLEKDLQSALRENILQLEVGLTVVDGGNERRVASGFIDILARDNDGQTVVIELKAVKAPLKAHAQIASYMGDIYEDEGRIPRGILVAPDFDAKLVSAARVMPTLTMVQYHYTFSFSLIT